MGKILHNIADHSVADNQYLFEQMIRTFEKAGMPYCILAGYDDYPQHIPSDIDFMIPTEWNARLPAIVAEIAKTTGARLIQHLQHEINASYFVLARLDGDHITYLHPDSSSDYRRSGRVWLRADSVLQNRRRHARGFWIPSAADAFSYYLIKKLDKDSLSAAQVSELTERYREDTDACRERLYTLLPQVEACFFEKLLNGTQSFDPTISTCLSFFRHAMHSKNHAASRGERWSDRIKEMQRLWLRLRQPTGLRIVFLGPDGSGKSTVITALTTQLEQAFRRVEYRHLRPGKLPRHRVTSPITDPHAKPLRGKLGSLAKLLYFWSQYQLGNLLWLYPRYIRSTLVIFDRYYHDLLADPVRYRYSASLALARRMGRWLPQPDLVFILDAPAELLQLRKQEVPFAESARQRAAYRELSAEFRRASIIDTSQPPERIVNDILTQILDFLETRTADRLHFTPSMQEPHLCEP